MDGCRIIPDSPIFAPMRTYRGGHHQSSLNPGFITSSHIIGDKDRVELSSAAPFLDAVSHLQKGEETDSFARENQYMLQRTLSKGRSLPNLDEYFYANESSWLKVNISAIFHDSGCTFCRLHLYVGIFMIAFQHVFRGLCGIPWVENLKSILLFHDCLNRKSC
eukprot:Sdes_comp19733_c0_seq2m11713